MFRFHSASRNLQNEQKNTLKGLITFLSFIPATLRLVTAYVALPREGHKQVRRWFLQSQTYQALAMYPLLLLTVVGMVSLPFHSLLSNQAFGMGMAIFAALALTWCVWCTIASLHLYGRVRRKLHLSSL
jgi:hypothetical protein